MRDEEVAGLVGRIRQALAVVPNIEFYRYQVSFKLVKA